MTQDRGRMRELYPVTGEAYHYRTEALEDSFTFALEGEGPEGGEATIRLSIEARPAGEGLCRTAAGRTIPFAWVWVNTELHLWLDGALFVFQRPEARRRSAAPDDEASGEVRAPMSGSVVAVLVSEGERVEQDQTVVIMESMKMELVIAAPRSGVVRRVAVEPGQQVERHMRLLELSPGGE